MPYYLLFVFLLCMIASGCEGASRKDWKVQRILERMAVKQNEKCPLIIDDVTRLDSCAVSGYKVYNYYYTLIVTTTHFDSVRFKNIKQIGIINNLRNTYGMYFYRNNDITFNYVYRDSLKNYLCLITITPDDYKSIEP